MVVVSLIFRRVQCYSSIYIECHYDIKVFICTSSCIGFFSMLYTFRSLPCNLLISIYIVYHVVSKSNQPSSHAWCVPVTVSRVVNSHHVCHISNLEKGINMKLNSIIIKKYNHTCIPYNKCIFFFILCDMRVNYCE